MCRAERLISFTRRRRSPQQRATARRNGNKAAGHANATKRPSGELFCKLAIRRSDGLNKDSEHAGYWACIWWCDILGKW